MAALAHAGKIKYALYHAKRERQQEEIMNTRKNSREKIRKLTMYAILAALVVVFQVLSTFITIGPISITLALTPIIVGAAIYGWKCGAFLGFVMGIIIYIAGLMGWDKGFVLFLAEENAILTPVLCLVKSTAAGALAGLVYQLISKKRATVATLTSSIIVPIVNTGIFVLGILAFFYGSLNLSAAGSGKSPLGFLLVSWVGINFIIEFIVNIALGTAVTRIIDYYNKNIAR